MTNSIIASLIVRLASRVWARISERLNFERVECPEPVIAHVSGAGNA